MLLKRRMFFTFNLLKHSTKIPTPYHNYLGWSQNYSLTRCERRCCSGRRYGLAQITVISRTSHYRPCFIYFYGMSFAGGTSHVIGHTSGHRDVFAKFLRFFSVFYLTCHFRHPTELYSILLTVVWSITNIKYMCGSLLKGKNYIL